MTTSEHLTAQRPIGSGFGTRSTTADVLAGVDLTGRLAVVTGGYSGLGLETTRALAGAGARVVVPARRRATAEAALADLAGVEVDALDLADLDSVRAFADRFLASGHAIDILVNSAGVMACPETRVGPGWEAQFATNHLGHYALVNRLWPALAEGGARVVSVSSRGHQLSAIRWDDPHFKGGYDKWQAYGQAKTANALFAVHLDRLGRDAGVRAFSLHPGEINTALVRHVSAEERIAAGWVDAEGTWSLDFKTPEQGAATQVWAATSPRLTGLGGVYCEDCESDAVLVGDDIVVVESARHRLTRLRLPEEAVRVEAVAHRTQRAATEVAPGRLQLDVVFQAPAGQKLDTRYGPSTRLLVSSTPPELLLTGEGTGTDLARELALNPEVGEGVLHVSAMAASCDDDPANEYPACHVHQQDWGVPVVIVEGGAARLPLVLAGMDRAAEGA
ncbi:oxidoreductase [Streptomyces hundungensis]|uniref:oxidoreductase n=1 Tax=Streptomyces hundungensis TaxID=1077946 RepID=UPI003406C233